MLTVMDIITDHFPALLDDVSRLKKIFRCHGDIAVRSESNAWESLRMAPGFAFLCHTATPLDSTAAPSPLPIAAATVAAAAAAHYQRRAALFATETRSISITIGATNQKLIIEFESLDDSLDFIFLRITSSFRPVTCTNPLLFHLKLLSRGGEEGEGGRGGKVHVNFSKNSFCKL